MHRRPTKGCDVHHAVERHPLHAADASPASRLRRGGHRPGRLRRRAHDRRVLADRQRPPAADSGPEAGPSWCRVYQDFRGGSEAPRPRRARACSRCRSSRPTATGRARCRASRRIRSPGPSTLGGRAPQEVEGIVVTCGYFDVLQVRPAIGTGFTAANCATPSAPPAVVLSHALVDARVRRRSRASSGEPSP